MFSTIKIYHNPECGTSRNTLALIQNAGIEPIVIEYLITPPSKAELIELIRSAGLSVREAIRKNVPPYSDLEIVREDWSDEQLLNFMYNRLDENDNSVFFIALRMFSVEVRCLLIFFCISISVDRI